ncbi:MAG TPA: transglutaminase domain-containing protein, partial [Gaiellaceae bacterium]
MRRTLLIAIVPAAVLAAAWLRLEAPHDGGGAILLMVALGVAPALWRPAIAPAVVLGARVAFGDWAWHPIRIAGAFANGFLDFYDVKTPFDPRVHTEMRGVVLTAIFGFTLLTSLAIARRWTLGAVGGVLLGAGWPATLAGNVHSLRTGATILVAALVVLAGLTTRRLPRTAPPAIAFLVLAALAATASSAVAKGGLVHWQRWDFYNTPAKPVSVAYVWDAKYDGISFPRKRTRVLRIDAPAHSLYWRAAVLDRFDDDRWSEIAPLRGDSLEPAVPKARLVTQRVHVLALNDTRLVGASVPLSFDAGRAPLVRPAPGFAQLPAGLTRGFSYTVRSYAARPTAAQLTRSPARYPSELDAFRAVWPGVYAPSFGTPRRAFLDAYPDIQRYVPLLHAALEVAGGARTPYGAAAALARWFQTTGGFTYTNHPAVDSAAPLVGFVVQTRAGYCQHFAGAMALMLRYLGVPARVAVGFSSGSYDSKHHRWDVSDHDAHAWVEAWFKGYGWLPFDPTPQSGRPERGALSAPYARTAAPTAAAAAPLLGGADRSAGHRHGETSSSTATAGTASTAKVHRSGSLALLLLLIIGGVITFVVAVKVTVRYAGYASRDPRRIAAACRQELAAYLLDQRIEGARSATLHELGELVRLELAVDPDRFVLAATAARFGPPAGA